MEDKKPEEEKSEAEVSNNNSNAPIISQQPAAIIRRPPPPSMLIDPRGRDVTSAESTINIDSGPLDVNSSTRSVPVLEATLVEDAPVTHAPKETVYEASLLIETSQHKDDEESYDSEEDQDDDMEEIKLRSWFLFAALINFGVQALNVAMASITRGPWGSLSTTHKVGRSMVYGSSGLGAVQSPVVVYKQRQIIKEKTLCQEISGLKKQQERMTKQNDVLSDEVNDLQSAADRMKLQGIGDNEMEELLNENKEINKELMKILKSRIVEKIVSLVLDIEYVDSNYTMTAEDIDKLITGMNGIEEIQSFEEVLFLRDVCRCKGHVEI